VRAPSRSCAWTVRSSPKGDYAVDVDVLPPLWDRLQMQGRLF
jgi:hypothetical protein